MGFKPANERLMMQPSGIEVPALTYGQSRAVLLVGSDDESYFLSVQLALDAHAIPYVAHRNQTEGVTRFSRYITVDATNFERAAMLVRGLQVTPPPGPLWQYPKLLLAGAAALLAFTAILLRRYLNG
jgi:hypothetical protein